MLPLEPSRLVTPPELAGRGPRVVRAPAAIDAGGVVAPAAMVVRGGRIEAVDEPARIGEVDAEPLMLHDTVLMPGLVNAHAHLDLTAVGPIPLEDGFEDWLATVRRRRPQEATAIADSVRLGVDRSLRGGVVAVGDIAGAFGLDAVRALARTGMAGVSFVELFGIGRRLDAGLAGLTRVRAELATEALERPGFRVGLSPHAPYSCGPALYQAAAAVGVPVSTHLAETPEEAEFTRRGRGPLCSLLLEIGAMDDGEPGTKGKPGFWSDGVHPIDGVLGIEPRRPWVLAHLNYPEEPDETEPNVFERRAAALRRCGAVVVFCPRASRFLGHPRPGRPSHPWSRLLEEGVEVALGTDGLPCLETETRLTTLDDARLLWREGAGLPAVVRMMTVAGARALGLAEAEFSWSGTGAAGVLGVPIDHGTDATDGATLARALGAGTGEPTWLLAPRPADLGG